MHPKFIKTSFEALSFTFYHIWYTLNKVPSKYLHKTTMKVMKCAGQGGLGSGLEALGHACPQYIYFLLQILPSNSNATQF